MISFLLENTLIDYLSTPNKLVGIILAALGVALALLCKKIVRVVKKREVASNDRLYVILLGISLCMIMVGFIITIF